MSTNNEALYRLEAHGERPADANLETVEKGLVGLVVYPASTLVTQKQFNISSNPYPTQYQNETFPSAGVAYTVVAVTATINMQFTQTTIGGALLQKYFEENSKIRFVKNDKEIFNVTLGDLSPYTLASLGTTVSILPKFRTQYTLLEHIKVGANERFEIYLDPASNLTTSATTTATTPYMPGLGLAADQGYGVKLNMRALYHRKVS